MASNDNPQPTSMTDVLGSAKPTLRDICLLVINRGEGGIYHEPSCMLCSSKSRTEAEALWRQLILKGTPQGQSKEAAVRELLLSANEDISMDAVRNHCFNHMDRGDIELRKLEHISKVLALNGMGAQALELIRLTIWFNIERLTSVGEIAADRYTTPNEAQEIRTRTVTTVSSVLTKLFALETELIGKMEGKDQLLMVPADRLKGIFDKVYSKTSSPEQQELVRLIVEEITKASIG